MPSVEYVTPTTTEANGFTLYIGCMPLGSTPIMGLDYCDAAHEYMRDQNGGTHYALVEYGKGKAMLQIALADLIKVNELKGDVVLMRSEIEELCAPVFRNLAQKVVVAL